jgi:endonuclease YncB( thermonuclease family)
MILRSFAILAAIALATPSGVQTRVVDGDTLELDGTIYRLNGIDAPEHGQRCGDWNCGSDATDALVEIVKGREVTCEPISEDGYGRVIATCFTGGTDLGQELVDKGLAWAFRRYSTEYVDAETRAKSRAIGIWSDDFLPPWDYREARWNRAIQEAPQGCPIKGNISRNGKIYHPPWSPWYEKTRINTENGERWFCSEAEAISAGWRAPYWN